MKFDIIYNEKIDEKLYIGTHKSGLRFALCQKTITLRRMPL